MTLSRSERWVASVLLVAVVLIAAGTLTPSWVADGKGEDSVGPLVRQLCGTVDLGSHHRSLHTCRPWPWSELPYGATVHVLAALSALGALASALCALARSIRVRLRRDGAPPAALAYAIYAATLAAMVGFALHARFDITGVRFGWSGAVAIGGVILAIVGQTAAGRLEPPPPPTQLPIARRLE